MSPKSKYRVAANFRLKILFSFGKALNDNGHQRGLKMAAKTVRKKGEEMIMVSVVTVVVDSLQHVFVTHHENLAPRFTDFGKFSFLPPSRLASAASPLAICFRLQTAMEWGAVMRCVVTFFLAFLLIVSSRNRHGFDQVLFDVV